MDSDEEQEQQGKGKAKSKDVQQQNTDDDDSDDYADLFDSIPKHPKQQQQHQESNKQQEAANDKELDTIHHNYIRDNCLVPSYDLRSFGDVVGTKKAKMFANSYKPVAVGAQRAFSGLLLFGYGNIHSLSLILLTNISLLQPLWHR